MIIYTPTGEQLLDLQVDDNSYRMQSIMGENALSVYYSLTEYIEIPIFSYTMYKGVRYTLWKPENFKKEHSRNYAYTLLMESSQELLKAYKYKLLSVKPYQLKFPLTAKPKVFLQLLVDNLNLYDAGWTVGNCIEAGEQTLSFSYDYCNESLSRIAEAFKTEYEIDNKTIHLCKVEKFKDSPVALSYGKGNGFKTGIGRANEGDKRPATILYVQGGERNIDAAKYKSKTLLLPRSQELEHEGRRYKTDAEGMYIQRADKELTVISEDGYDASEIYPKRVGTVTEVIVVNQKDCFVDFKDNTIPAELDFSKCRIDGEKATIIFQTGNLAGKEFDLEQDKTLTGYIHSERRFKLVPQEYDGLTMPEGKLGATYTPHVGDKYAVFNIALPDAYVCNNSTKEGASWDMFRQAARYLHENEDPRFSFSGELDGLYAKKQWFEIGGKLMPGCYIKFSDTHFMPEGTLIRVTGLKEFLNKPYSPQLELSNVTTGASVANDLGKIEANEVVTEGLHKDALQYTKRSYRDVKETLAMMFDPEGDYFTELIKPLAIETAQLIVGTNSQQFDFERLKFIPNPNGDANGFKSTTGKLVHQTVDPSGIRKWNLPPSTHVLDNSKAYYVYAKCEKTGETGGITLLDYQIKVDADVNYYHFWIGILNTPADGVRSWQPMHGFTEITGQQITTGIIKDRLARLVIDLNNAKITAQNGATFEGPMRFSSGSSGLGNLDEWSGVNNRITGAQNDATNAGTAAGAANRAASAADSKAANARTAADAAARAAEAAQEAANTAGNAAGIAQKAADAARVYADNVSEEAVRVFGETIIVGGKIINDKVNTDTLVVKNIYSKNGKFKTTEDGTIEAVDGKFSGEISAKKGNIGGFEIGNGRIGRETSTSGEGMSLYENFIKFRRSGRSALMGDNILPASSGASAACSLENHESNPYGINYTLLVSAKNGNSNVAIAMLSGCISGLAWNVRRITVSTLLNNNDVWVSCYNSSPITVTLPSNPTEGKVIMIKIMNNIRVTVNGGAYKLVFDNSVSSWDIPQWGGTVQLIYDGQYWCANYIRF